MEDIAFINFFGFEGKAAMLACDRYGTIPQDLLYHPKSHFRQEGDEEHVVLVRYTLFERTRQGNFRKLLADKNKILAAGNVEQLWRDRRDVMPDAPKVPKFTRQQIQEAAETLDTESESEGANDVDERGMLKPPAVTLAPPRAPPPPLSVKVVDGDGKAESRAVDNTNPLLFQQDNAANAETAVHDSVESGVGIEVCSLQTSTEGGEGQDGSSESTTPGVRGGLASGDSASRARRYPRSVSFSVVLKEEAGDSTHMYVPTGKRTNVTAVSTTTNVGPDAAAADGASPVAAEVDAHSSAGTCTGMYTAGSGAASGRGNILRLGYAPPSPRMPSAPPAPPVPQFPRTKKHLVIEARELAENQKRLASYGHTAPKAIKEYQKHKQKVKEEQQAILERIERENHEHYMRVKAALEAEADGSSRESYMLTPSSELKQQQQSPLATMASPGSSLYSGSNLNRGSAESSQQKVAAPEKVANDAAEVNDKSETPQSSTKGRKKHGKRREGSVGSRSTHSSDVYDSSASHFRRIKAMKRVALCEMRHKEKCFRKGQELERELEEIPTMGTIQHTIHSKSTIGRVAPLSEHLRSYLEREQEKTKELEKDIQRRWRHERIALAKEKRAEIAEEERLSALEVLTEAHRMREAIADRNRRMKERQRANAARRERTRMTRKHRAADAFNGRNTDAGLQSRYEHDQEGVFRKQLQQAIREMDATKSWTPSRITQLTV